jgi:hypothetical protein
VSPSISETVTPISMCMLNAVCCYKHIYKDQFLQGLLNWRFHQHGLHANFLGEIQHRHSLRVLSLYSDRHSSRNLHTCHRWIDRASIIQENYLKTFLENSDKFGLFSEKTCYNCKSGNDIFLSVCIKIDVALTRILSHINSTLNVQFSALNVVESRTLFSDLDTFFIF